jgi:hypothetical protein
MALLLAIGLLGTAAPAAGWQEPAAADRHAPSPVWHAGVELGRVPAARLGLESVESRWILGADLGVGPGREAVTARLTPAVRLGRELGWGLRVGAGLGFELAWLDEGEDESEVQWELTAGWTDRRGVRLEGGVRRTDYREGFWEPVARLGWAGAWRASDGQRVTRPPRSAHEPGVPPVIAERGRLDLSVGAVTHPGSGAFLEASNPRGDPDPWEGRSGPNVDRLGGRAEVWWQGESVRAWARWSSDLHTDTSIVARIRPVAEGVGFPVTASFGAGLGWSAPGGHERVSAGLRHDPRAFFWMPHLGEERTARVWVAEADGALGPVEVLARHARLESMEGRTLEPLQHTLLRAERHGRLTLGVEHERLGFRPSPAEGAPPAQRAERTRGIVGWDGPVGVRLAVGDDVVLRIEMEDRSVADRAAYGGLGEWLWAGGALEVRTSPALLDYEALLGRGWAVPGPLVPSLRDGPSTTVTGAVGWGPIGLDGLVGHDLPVWSPVAPARRSGGYLDLVLRPVGHARATLDGRLRTAEWGSALLWWRDQPTAEGRLTARLLERPARLTAELYGRTEIRSERIGLEHSEGMEASLGIGAPLASWALGLPLWGEARLEDVFDRGLAVRPGAPRRGRRLTILVGVVG